MSIKQRIRTRLGREPVFECVGCGQTVTEKRINCPNCSWCLRKVR